MRFTGVYTLPRLNLNAYLRNLHDVLSEAMARAAFAWLEATADKIPQWSGASAATFLHLAREVSYSLPISQAGIAPNRVNLGLRHGDGSVEVDRAQGRYFFSYSTTLEHLIYNEFNNANVKPDPTLFSRLINPGPYRFQQRGKVAFLRVASSVRLPNPFLYLKTRKVKVG
jgi:hypothetical protein